MQANEVVHPKSAERDTQDPYGRLSGRAPPLLARGRLWGVEIRADIAHEFVRQLGSLALVERERAKRCKKYCKGRKIFGKPLGTKLRSQQKSCKRQEKGRFLWQLPAARHKQ